MNPRLIVMLKYPRPGEVKTRLIPALGDRRACELYRAMVRHTLGEARRFVFNSGASLMARVAGAPSDEAVRQWLGDGISFQPQGDGDLGQRMERALQEAFAEGASSAVVIGADCPELAAEHLDAAVRALQHNEAVLGPAADGGYYLIGLQRFLPELFRNVRWSTDSVLEETLAIMEDYEFARRLRRLGRIVIAPSAAVTSGRRWQRLGWMRTTLLNRAIILAYRSGVSPSRLAGWYRGRNPPSADRATAPCIKPLPVRVSD